MQEPPYDIFISYVQRVETDWVKAFQKRLRTTLMAELTQAPHVFWDRAELSGHSQLTKDIKSALESARALIVIVSRPYLDSEWCEKERKFFLAKRDRLSCVYVILIQDVSPEEWPSDLRGLDCPGFEFWNDCSPPPGTTLPMKVRSSAFDKMIRKLAKALAEQFEKRPPPERQPLDGVPSRNPNFFGRKKVLAQLHTALKPEQDQGYQKTQLIYGITGSGKSQIAIEYVHSRRRDFSAIWWISAESDFSLTKGFHCIAYGHLIADATATDTLERAHERLRSEDQWLLVFDQVSSPELLRKYLPGGHHGSILITSIYADFDLSTRSPILISGWTEAEAFGFLNKRIRAAAKANPSAARELATRLKDFPIALSLAAGYIEKTMTTIEMYLKCFEHTREVFRGSWTLTFDKLRAGPPESTDLLYASAMLEGESIPSRLIIEAAHEFGESLDRALVPQTPARFNEVASILHHYAVISFPESEDGGASKRRQNRGDAMVYRMHRLLQEEVQRSMGQEACSEWAGRVVNAVSRVFPRDMFEDWENCSELLPQLHQAATLALRYGLKSPQAVDVLGKLGYFLWSQALFNDAIEKLKDAKRIADDIWTVVRSGVLPVLDDLGFTYSDVKRFEEAEGVYLEAREIREKELAGNAMESAKMWSLFAGLNYKRGEDLRSNETQLEADKPINADSVRRFKQSEEEARIGLKILEAVEGLGKAKLTAQLHNTLCGALLGQGKSSDAQASCLTAIEIAEKQLPGMRRSLGFYLCNLAEIECGLRIDGTKHAQRAREILEKLYRSEHPHLLFIDELIREFAQLNGDKP